MTVYLLLLLVILKLALEVLLQCANLAVFCGVPRAIFYALGRVHLQEFDLILDASVENLSYRDEVLQLCGGRVIGTAENTLMNGPNLRNVRGKLTDFGPSVLDAA